MLGRGILLATLCISLAVVALSSETAYTRSWVPAFLWSGRSYVSGKNDQLLQSTTMKTVLQSFLGVGDNTEFVVDSEMPRALLLFVGSSLQTDHIPLLNSAYNDQFSPAFSYLKNALQTSSSSLTVPYVHSSESTASLLASTLPTLSSVKVLKFTYTEELDSSEHRLEDFEKVLKAQAKDIPENTRLVVVVKINVGEDDMKEFMDSRAAFAEADSVVKSVTELVDELWSGDYAAIFTGESPSEGTAVTDFAKSIQALRVQKRQLRTTNRASSDGSGNGEYSSYFPPFIWEAIIVAVVLLIILSIGVSATFNLQAPDRFEGGQKQRN